MTFKIKLGLEIHIEIRDMKYENMSSRTFSFSVLILSNTEVLRLLTLRHATFTRAGTYSITKVKGLVPG
jgi:hypothetical protein